MTSKFKRLSLAAAVAGTIAAGTFAPAVYAVNQTDNGLGQVALIPYYTVRNDTDTYLSIVNTSSTHVIAVKLRFRERDNSRDARDFNIFLSPNDVWTAVVTMNANGVPVVQTNDISCTTPALSESAATRPGFRGVEFTSMAYDGDPRSQEFPADGGSTDINRTYDGHIEIIQMGAATLDKPLAAAAVHGAGQNCQALVNDYISNDVNNFKAQYDKPINVMKAAAHLITIDKGVAMMVPVDNLANFYNPFDPSGDLMASPERIKPDLFDVEPLESLQIEDDRLIQDTFNSSLGGPVDAVSSLFMSTSVINEYAIGGAANTLYDWVVTFPTKHYYVDAATSQTPPPIAPFVQAFNGASCVQVAFDYYDREENFPSAPAGDLNFSPRPSQVVDVNSLCQEVNILSFDQTNSALIGELTGDDDLNVYGVPLEDGYESGWMHLRFTNSQNLVGDTYTYYGLPVTGFGLKTYTNQNNAVANVRLDYGLTQEHAYERRIELN